MKELTAETLRDLVSYDSATGEFRWRRSTNQRIKVGDIAGCIRPDGYKVIKIFGMPHLAHRLAWLYTHGAWPKDGIDHINGGRKDNRLDNLREATNSQNQWNSGPRSNNKSGFRGVSWYSPNRKWAAEIQKAGGKIHLGYFSTPEAASKVYEKKATELFGEFKRK